MTDLTPYIHPTKHAIEEYWRNRDEVYTRELGTLRSSELGDECSRKLWLRSKGHIGERPEPRVLRLFDRGHKEEDRIIEWLEGIGCKVWDQQKTVKAFNGRFTGHIDGLVVGVKEAPQKTHLLEMKTCNDKNFKKLNKEGVSFQHMVQMNIYMRLLGIDRALYFAVNKNDDDIYLERVKLNIKLADAQLMRAQRIMDATSPPERIGNGKPSWYQCKMCELNKVCFSDDDKG